MCGKRKRKDIEQFALNLGDNILILHRELEEKTYQHGSYHAFKINDPKPRDIHKASVRDRILHHAICRILYPYFDKVFIYDSYSCRIGKGTHRAMNRLKFFSRKISKNNTKQCWILKCDIKKFFANIDHEILKSILKKHIVDGDILWLLDRIINSFNLVAKPPSKGLPLGNLTSQLLVNIYMNEFDQFIKHQLKIKYYIRYADDFVILSQDKQWLLDMLSQIRDFLWDELHLQLHPNKVSIHTLASGIDFLGWVHFLDHRVLRTATKRRMFKKLKQNKTKETLASYQGLLSHGNTHCLLDHIALYYDQ